MVDTQKLKINILGDTKDFVNNLIEKTQNNIDKIFLSAALF